VQLEEKDLLHLKWYLGQALALLSLWTVSALDLAQGSVLAGVTLLCLVVMIFPSIVGVLSPTLKRLFVPLLLLSVLWDFFTSGQDVIPPLIRLLLILLAIRIFSYRNTREDMQMIIIAMFLSMVSGVFTLSILFALQATIFAMGTIALLFLINLLETNEGEESSRIDFHRFSRWQFLRKIFLAIDARLVRGFIIITVLLIISTGVLFVSIPRLHLDQAVPFLRLPQASLSGFSDVVRFGEVTDIQEDNSPALRIDVPDRSVIPSTPYWRMLVLDRYDQGAFINSMVENRVVRGSLTNSAEISPYETLSFRGTDVATGDWTFYMEGGVSRYLPILGPFLEMRFQGRQRLNSNPQISVFYLPETSNSVFSYRVTDFLISDALPASSIDEPLLSIIAGDESLEGRSSSEMRTYPYSTLALPVSQEEAVYLQNLLSEILAAKQGREDPKSIAEAIEDYLKATHGYSLVSSLPGQGDPVVEWLQQGSAGHCEFFAGAFALLARTAGIPTRMVVGFSGGAWNSYEDYFVVRNSNAHAWCEYFNGSYWVRIDPTTGSASRGSGDREGFGMAGFAYESGFHAWVDSLRVIWYRRVINFDEDAQVAMTEGLAANVRNLATAFMDKVRNSWEATKELVREIINQFRQAFYQTTLMAVFLIIFCFFAFRLLWNFFGMLRYRFLWMGKGLHPLRRAAAKELARLQAKVDLPRDEPYQAESKGVEEALLEVRFGPRLDEKFAKNCFRKSRSLRKRGRVRHSSA